MKAIITKYHGPGNVRGSRISASTMDGKFFGDVEYRILHSKLIHSSRLLANAEMSVLIINQSNANG